jgi:hypothetical protein
MKPLRDLFDPDAADDARDEAMDCVEEGADPEWHAFVSALIVEVARSHAEFTTDEIERLRVMRGGPSTPEPRAMGPLMKNAARAGVCAKTDRVRQSAQVCNHRRPMQIWRSLIYRAVPRQVTR